MIYMVLKYGMAIRDNALARITVPVNFGQEEDGSWDQRHGKTSRNPLRITKKQLKLHETFERIKAYSTNDCPFLVWINSEGNLQVICRKDVVSKVFKTLYSNQKSIGLALVDVKTHVNLTPLSIEEIGNAYGTDILNALRCKGWWSLETGHLLERSIVTDVSTSGRSRCGSLKLNHVSILSKSNLLVMLDPTVVEFRHIVTQEVLSKTIQEASEALSGSIVRVLPTLTYAIVCKVRLSTNEEAKDMFRCWNAMGIQLKFPESVEYAVDVRFEEDEDSSWLTFPASLVLSPSGFATERSVFGDHMESDVYFLLSHLVRDLETAEFSLWSPGSLRKIEIRSIESKSGQIVNSSRSLWSSAVAPGSKQASKDLPALGGIIDLTNYLDLDGAEIEQRFRNLSSKKVSKATHRRAGPELHSLFSKLAQQKVVNVIHTKSRDNKCKISQKKVMIARNNEKRSPVKINLAKKGIKGKGSAEKANRVPLEKSSKRQTCKSNMQANTTGVSKDLHTHLEIKHLFDQGKLEKHKMPVLKTFCKSLGISNKGKKQEIVQKIKEHLESMPDIRLES